MSLAARYRLSLQQGGSHTLSLTYVEKETGNPVVDLSLYSAELQIRKTMDGALELELTTDAGEISMETDGTILCNFSKTQIDGLSSSNQEITDWVWGLRIWETGNEDDTSVLLVRGPLTISPSPVR